MGEHFTVDVGGELVPVTVRRNKQARRLILRVDRTSGEVKLTLPPRVGSATAEQFLLRQRDWIAKERATIEPLSVVTDGAVLPYLGEDHHIIFTGTTPRTVVRSEGQITVGGPCDMAQKRLEAWLRREAKQRLEECAQRHAETLGVCFTRISIGDMKSRWGSCSSRGTLRFNWRLLMAPYAVMDYVAAHEVAHLREMNHSDRFWAEVEKCVPDHRILRRWLKANGNELFKIRF